MFGLTYLTLSTGINTCITFWKSLWIQLMRHVHKLFTIAYENNLTLFYLLLYK